MRLIIVEKTQFFNLLPAAASERWPGEQIAMMASMPYLLNRYTYPRGLAYKDYPLVASPLYGKTDKRFDDGSFALGAMVVDGVSKKMEPISFTQASALMQDAEHLVFAGDWDHTGVWGMERMLELLAPERDKTDYEVGVFNGGLDEASIRRVLSSLRRPDDQGFQALSNAAQVKRYFDYNFNLNSLAILGNLYRSIASTNQPVLITKYMVQALLFVIKHGEDGTPKRDWLQHWKGTGKYEFVENEWWMDGMGSPASRQSMLRQLEELGLIQVCENNCTYGLAFRGTPMGIEFVGRLHKDCSDPDLPFRLSAWMGFPFAEIKPVIDKYLLTFFRRQKRHQGV
jgi:hypothetical protein